MKFKLSNVGYWDELQHIYPELSNFKIITQIDKRSSADGFVYTHLEQEIEINTLEELLRLNQAVNNCGLVIYDGKIIVYDGYLEE